MTEQSDAGTAGEDQRCVAALRTLAAGELKSWHGLPDRCALQDAETAFGPSDPGPNGSAMLGGVLTEFRRFPPTSVAPHGIVVWLEEGEIITVEIVEPHLPAPIQDQLGAPEAETPSALAAFHTQLIYATRGLALHIHQFRSTVFRLYAFAPTTVADFLASPLAGVATQRTPRF